MTAQHSLIIDTTLYSGDFERHLCAYLTGQTGECGVGRELADQVAGELRDAAWWAEHTVQTADENGCHCPVAIAPTPGFANDGMGGHYENTEEGRAAALPRYRTAVQAYCAEELRRLDAVKVGKHGWTQQALDDARARAIERRNAAVAKPEVDQWPAYQSVEIFLDTDIPDEVLVEVRTRLKKVEEDPYGTGVFYSCDPTHQPAAGFKVLGLRSSHTPAPVSRTRPL